MLDKLAQLEEKYDELNKKLADPDILADHNNYPKYAKAHSELETVMVVYREYKAVIEEIKEAKELLEEKLEADFRQMLIEELEGLETKQAELEEKLKFLLLPKDPNDEKNVIVEIRAGTGGDEAALFAGDLLRMYSRYSES